MAAKLLQEELINLGSVSKYLQNASGVSLADAYDVFHQIESENDRTDLEHELGVRGGVIAHNFKNFNSGLVKLMRGESELLTSGHEDDDSDEQREMRVFKKGFGVVGAAGAVGGGAGAVGGGAGAAAGAGAANNQKRSYLEMAGKNVANQDKDGAVEEYEELHWIPPTSNICERTFSRSSLILGDLRHRLTPFHLELLLMLKMNRSYWDASTVQNILIQFQVEERARREEVPAAAAAAVAV